MARPSLTRRLIWTLTLGAAVLWLVTAFFAVGTLRARLDDAFDGGLREAAERLLPLALEGINEASDEGDQDGEHEVPLFEEGGNEYIVYQVRLADGTMLLRSHDAPAAPFAVPLDEGFANAAPWRVYTIGTPKGDFFIQVAETTTHRTESLGGSVLALVLPIGILVPLSALGIFLAVRRGVRPVADFARQIGERQASNLAPIGGKTLPSELAPIAGAVDELILRVRTALDAERAFASNSAHELRTPVAGSLAQTQRLIAELEGNPAQARARQVEASLIRLRQLSEKLLQLSRADAGIAAAENSVDLMPALRILVEDARRRMPDPERLVLDDASTLRGRIDLDAFGIVLRNLLDNAVLHGDPQASISVSAGANAVTVINGGPVIPADRLKGLTQRFVRGATEAAGSGLGLAIVDTIATQSGGRLELQSPVPGRTDGFSARLVLAA